MIDHTFDPLPRRTTRTDHDVRGGQIWFSRDTINKARSYDDVSWLQVSRTAQIGAGLALTGLLLGSGQLGSLLILAGIAGIAVNMPAMILKAAYSAKAS
ncbi:hypothetical protein [uncultured Maricaulis sp.]|uniref:hypothetical protein n=1 Tax=uncultured Maricaulis sp. TaxID=174710 RepID=UPI0030DBF0D6